MSCRNTVKLAQQADHVVMRLACLQAAGDLNEHVLLLKVGEVFSDL